MSGWHSRRDTSEFRVPCGQNEAEAHNPSDGGVVIELIAAGDASYTPRGKVFTIPAEQTVRRSDLAVCSFHDCSGMLRGLRDCNNLHRITRGNFVESSERHSEPLVIVDHHHRTQQGRIATDNDGMVVEA